MIKILIILALMITFQFKSFAKDINILYIYDSKLAEAINVIVERKTKEINTALKVSGITDITIVSLGYSKIIEDWETIPDRIWTISDRSFKDIHSAIKNKKNGFENVLTLNDKIKADLYVYLTTTIKHSGIISGERGAATTITVYLPKYKDKINGAQMIY